MMQRNHISWRPERGTALVFLHRCLWIGPPLVVYQATLPSVAPSRQFPLPSNDSRQS